MDITELRRGLHELADAPGPATTDLTAVRNRGRRALRLRRAATAGTSVLAVGAVAAGLAAVTIHRSPAAKPPPVLTTARPRQGFSALASFGWLPPGWRVIDTTAGQQDTGENPGAATSGPPKGFSISAQSSDRSGVHQVIFTLYPEGPEPRLGFMRGGVAARPVAAAPVTGHQAHWMQPPPPGPGTAAGEARLRIRYAADQWAEIEVNDVPGGDVSPLLRRIAEGVRVTAAPMAFPVRMNGLPAAFTPSYADVATVSTSSIGWSVILRLNPGLTVELRPQSGDRSFRIGRRKTNTTVGGHPATYWPTGDGMSATVRPSVKPLALLCVYQVNGMDVCLTAGEAAVRALKPAGGLFGVFAHVSVLGMSEPAWTTTPLG